MIKKIISMFVSKNNLSEEKSRLQTNFNILSEELGQSKSIKLKMSVDAAGSPIPWYTYPAIEYLSQLDMTEKNIFEFGSGNSSIFWASRAKKIVTIEDNKEWFDICDRRRPENLDLILLIDKTEYISYITKLNRLFDVIIIDGKHRAECAANAWNFLKDDGMIILDNADWYPKTAEFLRRLDLIEIDFSGFGPINNYTWTTSLFLKRGFNFKTLSRRQPAHPVGGLKQYANADEQIS